MTHTQPKKKKNKLNFSLMLCNYHFLKYLDPKCSSSLNSSLKRKRLPLLCGLQQNTVLVRNLPAQPEQSELGFSGSFTRMTWRATPQINTLLPRQQRTTEHLFSAFCKACSPIRPKESIVPMTAMNQNSET